jgi:hypothetical protein
MAESFENYSNSYRGFTCFGYFGRCIINRANPTGLLSLEKILNLNISTN